MKKMCRLIAKNAHILYGSRIEHDVLVIPDADGLSSETSVVLVRHLSFSFSFSY